MPYETDGLVGKLALQKGLISSAQLKECLAEQSTLLKAGQKRPLGVIMVTRGLMKDEDLLDLLEEQRRYLAERSNYSQVRKDDFLFGQILIKQGIATSDEVNQALRAQAEAAERGEMPVPRLGQILLDMGVSDENTIQKTLRIQYKTLYECPGCVLKYNLVNTSPEKQYRCKKCGSILVPKAPGTGVKADESAYGLKLEVSPDVPDEVAQAEKDPQNHFDKYILVREIGRGGMGTVYRAYQKDLKRFVALKLLRGGDPETISRFTREAQTAGRLKHPNIVSVYEIGRFNNVPFLTMEFIDGHPLDELDDLPLKRSCQVLRDVAMAIHYAHQKGVIHRDLKPQNILIDRDGRAYVTDFGLAREVAGGKDLTLEGIVVGTPAYMSPEQAKGHRNLDGRSDVASLGCVLYELLTGRQPYTGRSPIDIALAVIHQEVVPPRRRKADVPPELEAVCLKALEKEKERRYPTTRALAEDLQRYLEGEPVVARPPSMVRMAIRRMGRHKIPSAVGAASLVATAIVLALLLSVTRQSQTKDAIIRGRELEKRGELEKALVVYARDPHTAVEGARVRQALRHREDEARRQADRQRAQGVLAALSPETPPEERIDQATRALEIDPNFEDAFVARAQAYEELGKDAAAYDDLGRAARLSSSPLPHHMNRADLARRLGRTEEEIAALSAAIELNPLSTDLLLHRAWAFARLAGRGLQAGSPERVKEIPRLLESAEADLGRVRTHALLSTVQAALAEIAPAAGHLGPEARRRLAQAFADSSRRHLFAEKMLLALKAADHAISVDPECAWGYLMRGFCRSDLGQETEALGDAARAAELDRSLREADLLVGLSRVRRSLRTMRDADPGALRIAGPGPTPSWIADFADGAAQLEEFAEEALPSADFAELARRGGELVRTVPDRRLDDGRTLRPELSSRLVGRAAEFLQKGRNPAALGLLHLALALDDRNIQAYLQRAELRYRSRDFAAAAEDWERAEALDPALRATLEPQRRDARRRSGG
jgi:tetratricopeptide (TPR) repeat protein/predicted Ser/Thr protein kinase